LKFEFPQGKYIKVRWHGDVDLEVVHKWHASTYLCTLLRYYVDVYWNNTKNKDSRDVDNELKGDDALDINENAPIAAYLQPYEILIRLTPKEHN
jgi:hypothetical protein